MTDILTKLCIICTILGISLLIIISNKIDIPKSDISKITKNDIDKPINIQGTVKTSLTRSNSISILEVQDKNASIQVIMFKVPEKSIKIGSFVKISGKVALYQDNLQIIADIVET